MIIPAQAIKIVIATKPVDFRKGHDGLAAYVEKELGLKAYSGIVVVFRAKRADRVKILVWDGSGLVLTYKRLEVGKFAWPAINDADRVKTQSGFPDGSGRGTFGHGTYFR